MICKLNRNASFIMFTVIKKGKKKYRQVAPVMCSSCSHSAGLYSLLVNYSLWRGKLTQFSISKHYELSHFPCPPVKRKSGRSSLQWYAGHVGLLSYRSNTQIERISSFLLKRGMRSLGFLCKVNSEARHAVFKIQSYPRRVLETHCASRGNLPAIMQRGSGLKVNT